ncbi:alpha/beta fold hydrolase [Actinomycetospora straminea]|uniref:Alpha/beta hydrolase n=1 Tax=Actinomycetospora straminea TaxID=663607 RepID=A0ABP9F5A5_9PSEU|nr:alpha/beta hydrolase [Actinomycetospora straminea]MDD7936213.1 alpha/beta hydrolase [Actinomycetospora straminea]
MTQPEPADRRVLSQPALADLGEVPADSRWVRSRGPLLHLLDYGPEGRPPLVVVPGITSPAISMDFVVRGLTDLVRPVVLDVRGRGLSDNGDAYDLDTYARDVEAVVRGLRLERPILLGHSMGARIVAATAAAGRIDARGSVLVDPPMSGPGRGPYPTTLETFLGQLDQARAGATADDVAASWPRWPRREQELRARWMGSISRDAIVATHAGFESEDFFAIWPSVPAPTVLIHGGDSPVVTAAGAEEAAKANPEASVVDVPGTGHMVFWDDPAAALEATREALRSLV